MRHATRGVASLSLTDAGCKTRVLSVHLAEDIRNDATSSTWWKGTKLRWELARGSILMPTQGRQNPTAEWHWHGDKAARGSGETDDGERNRGLPAGSALSLTRGMWLTLTALYISGCGARRLVGPAVLRSILAGRDAAAPNLQDSTETRTPRARHAARAAQVQLPAVGNAGALYPPDFCCVGNAADFC